MIAQLVIDADFSDWASTVIALGSLLAALFAVLQAGRSNKTADKANQLATESNVLSERTTRLQEDQSRVRLSVKCRMMFVYNDNGPHLPRAIVEVINLSSFPVTINNIHWKVKDDTWLYWENPTIGAPFHSLPTRLPSREALTAMGADLDDGQVNLLNAVAAVAFTACGEQIEGSTVEFVRDFQEYLANGYKKPS